MCQHLVEHVHETEWAAHGPLLMIIRTSKVDRQVTQSHDSIVLQDHLSLSSSTQLHLRAQRSDDYFAGQSPRRS